MAALRRIATMTGWSVFRTARSLGDLFWILVLPVLLSFLIASMFGFGTRESSPPQLLVVDEDQTSHSADMIDALAAVPFRVDAVLRDAAEEMLVEGEAEFALALPAGFGESVAAGAPQIELMHRPSYVSREAEAQIRLVAQSLVDGEAVTFNEIVNEAPRGNVANGEFEQVRGVFGIILVFSLTALLTRAGTIHQERKQGSLQRMIVSGVPYRDLVVAHVASIVIIGLLQAAILLTITGSLGIPWLIEGWSPIVWTVVGSVFCGAGIAIGISGFVRSEGVMPALAGGLPSLLAMLGGAFFPIDVAPAAIQQMARLNPLYWSMKALSGGLVYEGFASQAVPLALLLLIGVCGIVVGIQGLRRMELT